MQLIRLLRRKHPFHPYRKLKMGLINQYSLIVPKATLSSWLEKGWIEAPDYYEFHYAPQSSETVILGKPKTLSVSDKNTLIGKKLIGYKPSYGSYGMGGPGFLGLILETQPDAVEENVLIYAVWSAAQYTLIDDRVVECNPVYYEIYHPWTSRFADEDIHQWDDLTPVLIGSRIDSIELTPNRCAITISKEDRTHIIEFLKNDPRLPLRGDGNPRTDAFSSGVISDVIVFQYEKAVLWV